MSRPMPAERSAVVEPPSPRPPRVGAGPHPAVPAVGSALLLWSTFPPANWGWLAWVALVPLFLMVESRRSWPAVYFGAWVGGMVFWALAVQWVRLCDESAWFGWLLMAFALSMFWPLWLGLTRLAVRRLCLPRIVAAPVVWVALEYVRAYAVTGFPWYYLAHSQHRVLPLIQVADFAGSLGLSLVIAVVNAWVCDLLTLPLLRPGRSGPRLTARQAVRLASVTVLVGGTLAYGGLRLASARFRPGPRVALLQSNLLQNRKMTSEPKELLTIYANLVERANRLAERPDLIVWPETSYPYSFVAIDPALDRGRLDAQVKEIDPDIRTETWLAKRDNVAGHLRDWSDRLGLPMLVGSITYDHSAAGLSRYNSAILFQPGGKAPQFVHKIHLVPFGEYVPLVETFPWLTALTPYHGAHVPSLGFGPGPAWLDLGPYRLAAAICFEDTVPQVVRRFFAEAADGRQPDVLLNLSNDGWFQGSSEHDMHLAVSVFRCVENRVPLARAANVGVSAIVDGNGRVLRAAAKLTETVLAGVVPLDDRVAPYTRWGDWLGKVCLYVTIGFIPLALMNWRRGDRLDRLAL